jgi:hypothetical protein
MFFPTDNRTLNLRICHDKINVCRIAVGFELAQTTTGMTIFSIALPFVVAP